MVTVKLFGITRLKTGVKEFKTEAACVRDIYAPLYEEIRRVKPDTSVTLADIKGCLVSVNNRDAHARTRLKDGDVVFLFTASAGG